MQRPKDDIRRSILQAAGDEFLLKGFSKTSMRDIARRSEVGVGNLYNYFSSKDELFATLVRPAVDGLETMLSEHHGPSSRDVTEMCSPQYLKGVTEQYTSFIVLHRQQLRLLLLRAQGSSFENYQESFTHRANVLVRRWFEKMKDKHPRMQADVTDFSIRMHTIWMFALFEEMLKNEIPPGEVEKRVAEYMTIEVAGWRELMNM